MQNVKNTMLLWLLRGLAPHPCISCGVIGALLCLRCKSDITASWIDRCVGCSAPKGCTHTTLSWVSYVFDRTGPLLELVNSYKFRYRMDTAALFADLLASLLGDEVVLVPIPTIPAHIRQRGFDHALELVRAIAHSTKLQYVQPLTRTNTVVMHRLNKSERTQASEGLFVCRHALNPSTHYVLIDDIYTTGATLRAAKEALRTAGAHHISAAVLARQPLEELSTKGAISGKMTQSDTER